MSDHVQHYDFIIAGGGAAGLSLACHMLRSPLRDHTILVVDQDAKDQNDRTWSFWTDRPTLFDEIVSRSWDQLQFLGEDSVQLVDLHGYRYKMIRGIDLYRFAHQELSASGNVTFVRGVVEQIEDGPDATRVKVEGRTISGGWVFDSLLTLSERKTDPAHEWYLKLHFTGWEIETARAAFNPRAATFLDFRTPQHASTRFFYVLPLSERRALVEYTLFSPARLAQAEYAQALKDYLETTLGISDYRIVREESGVMPITSQPFARRVGRRVMTIGAKAGRVKPTTGFAFTRIQQDSVAIVQSLLRAGHPFDVPADSRRYRLYDSLMLQIMSGHGDQIEPIFTAMFEHNPIERILRFLDEVASPWENLLLIRTLPPRLFVRAVFQTTLRSVDWRHLAESIQGVRP